MTVGAIEKPETFQASHTSRSVLTKIREVRLARGVTVRQAARLADMTETFWSYQETTAAREGRSPKLSTVERMAAVLGLRVDLVPMKAGDPLESEPITARILERRPMWDTPTVTRIGARLRTIRCRLGLTQAQAASAAGVAKGTWGHLERGYVSARDIGVERVQAYADGIGARLEVIERHHKPFAAMDPDEAHEVARLVDSYVAHCERTGKSVPDALKRAAGIVREAQEGTEP